DALYPVLQLSCRADRQFLQLVAHVALEVDALGRRLFVNVVGNGDGLGQFFEQPLRASTEGKALVGRKVKPRAELHGQIVERAQRNGDQHRHQVEVKSIVALAVDHEKQVVGFRL